MAFVNLGENMVDKLDVFLFKKEVKKIIIGRLSAEVIDYFNLNCSPCNIVLWADRLKYTEKHKTDFKSEQEYYRHIEEIPNIISNPDYIGLHPSNNSIQYIKKIDENMLIGIRLKPTGDLNFRSAYPITQEKLNSYLKAGTLVKYKKIIGNID
ncbi:PBECR2 nuclease fold domain-containing protein [Irregularibacter muris]|uniref:PBECR2 nuclease fold domain-containing protein n=2 Tax=Irregularibacter muris TaxID=1796619 RepID=A0AAE3HEF1_9FIRM|nr:PBECR2 nuclease fold domain-containing protein [Irregularibacter muris]